MRGKWEAMSQNWNALKHISNRGHGTNPLSVSLAHTSPEINLEDQSVPALGCAYEIYGAGREMGEEKGIKWEKAFPVGHVHC